MMNMYLQTTEGNITMYIIRIFIDRFRLIKIFFAQNAFYLLFQCNGHLKWSIRQIYHDFSKTSRTPESSHRSGFFKNRKIQFLTKICVILSYLHLRQPVWLVVMLRRSQAAAAVRPDQPAVTVLPSQWSELQPRHGQDSALGGDHQVTSLSYSLYQDDEKRKCHAAFAYKKFRQ